MTQAEAMPVTPPRLSSCPSCRWSLRFDEEPAPGATCADCGTPEADTWAALAPCGPGGVTVDRATIYTTDGLLGGVSRTEVRDLLVADRPYAQHAHALHCAFIPKGKRKRRGYTVAPHDGWLLVARGWGHPDAPPRMTAPQPGTAGCMVRHQRHRAFAPEWTAEARARLKGLPLLVDSDAFFRHVGTAMRP